jgi:hypothetical protein
MSMSTRYTVVCDGPDVLGERLPACHVGWAGQARSAVMARLEARSCGWRWLNHQALGLIDLCPPCAAERRRRDDSNPPVEVEG